MKKKTILSNTITMARNCRKCQKICFIRRYSPVNGKEDYYCAPCNINQSEEWVNGVKIKFAPCQGSCNAYLEIKKDDKFPCWPYYTQCSGVLPPLPPNTTRLASRCSWTGRQRYPRASTNHHMF